MNKTSSLLFGWKQYLIPREKLPEQQQKFLPTGWCLKCPIITTKGKSLIQVKQWCQLLRLAPTPTIKMYFLRCVTVKYSPRVIGLGRRRASGGRKDPGRNQVGGISSGVRPWRPHSSPAPAPWYLLSSGKSLNCSSEPQYFHLQNRIHLQGLTHNRSTRSISGMNGQRHESITLKALILFFTAGIWAQRKERPAEGHAW